MTNTLRKLIDKAYQLSGAAAALSMFSMTALVLAQIVARQFHTHIPSSDNMIGFLVVWTSFLGLAYTMHQQQHIRLELIIGRLGQQSRRWLEVLIGLFALLMLSVLSYYVLSLIYESWSYNDQTDGEIPMPLWLVQLPMGIGCLLFTLSMLDHTLHKVTHRTDDSPISIEE